MTDAYDHAAIDLHLQIANTPGPGDFAITDGSDMRHTEAVRVNTHTILREDGGTEPMLSIQIAHLPARWEPGQPIDGRIDHFLLTPAVAATLARDLINGLNTP